MTRPTDEALEKINEVVYNYPKAWNSGCCAYDWRDRETGESGDGQKTPKDPYAYKRGSINGDVCHAGLNSCKKPFVVINAHRKEWAKSHPDFIRWVMSESPFAHGVLNGEDEWFEHAGVMDMELIGKGGCLWLCKAMRHFTEDDYKLKYWEQFRELGLDGLQAFIGCDILDMAGKPMSGSHVSLFSYSTPQGLRKVYDEIKATKRNDTSQAASGSGYGWGSYDGKNWGCLKGKPKKVDDGWGGFIMLDQPGKPKDYVEALKEIFEGDPKNVG